MSSLLVVRFIGSFLLKIDQADADSQPTAMIYLRDSDCPQKGKHTPIINFYPEQVGGEPDFDGDVLSTSVSGIKFASRRIPDAVTVSFDGVSALPLKWEVIKQPSQFEDTGLSVCLLPSLEAGGATSLYEHSGLTTRSSAWVDLGSKGILTCERVPRDRTTGKPLRWNYLEDGKGPSGSDPTGIFAEILNWTALLEDNAVTINVKSDVDPKIARSLTLGANYPTVFEVTISNLGETPAENTSNALEDFRCLLDYAKGRSTVRVPTLPGKLTSTGGSVICPGARWP